jgi:hypothetical protein
VPQELKNLSSLSSSIAILRSDDGLDRDAHGYSSCSPPSGGETLEAIAQEINQTVLPRLLCFRNEKQDKVALHVTARRVTDVEEISSELMPENTLMNLDKSVVVAQGQGIQALANSLDTFAARTTQLVVRRDIVKHRGSISNVGVPFAAILANRSGLTQVAQPVSPTSVASRIEAFRTEARAYMRFDVDQLVTREGDETALEKLDCFARATLTHRSSVGTPLEQNSLCAIITLQNTFVCASADNDSHFFSSDLATVSKILSQS